MKNQSYGGGPVKIILLDSRVESVASAGRHKRRDSRARCWDQSETRAGQAARTRAKKVLTRVSRSWARADRRAVQPVISPTASAPWFAACSTERISAEACAVLPEAVCTRAAISRVVAPCSVMAVAMLVETSVSLLMMDAIEAISFTAPLVAS